MWAVLFNPKTSSNSSSDEQDENNCYHNSGGPLLPGGSNLSLLDRCPLGAVVADFDVAQTCNVGVIVLRSVEAKERRAGNEVNLFGVLEVARGSSDEGLVLARHENNCFDAGSSSLHDNLLHVLVDSDFNCLAVRLGGDTAWNEADGVFLVSCNHFFCGHVHLINAETDSDQRSTRVLARLHIAELLSACRFFLGLKHGPCAEGRSKIGVSEGFILKD